MIKIKGENYVKNYEINKIKNLERVLKQTLNDKYLGEKILKSCLQKILNIEIMRKITYCEAINES